MPVEMTEKHAASGDHSEEQSLRSRMIDSNPRIQTEGEPGQYLERVRLGSYELRKKGALRFDLRDPYHLAVALTWLQF